MHIVVIASSDELENYHLNVQLLSALQSFIGGFSTLFSCPTTLLFWFTFAVLIASILALASSCLKQNSSNNPLNTTCTSTQQQTDTVSN